MPEIELKFEHLMEIFTYYVIQDFIFAHMSFSLGMLDPQSWVSVSSQNLTVVDFYEVLEL